MFTSSLKAPRNDAKLFLDTVWDGLEYIYREVQGAEADYRQRHNLTEENAKNMYHCGFGGEQEDSLVCNFFLWYANTLYNFVGVFSQAFSPKENLQQEFQNVITWRNKVAAHASWKWPKGDNKATQQMSIILFPEFSGGHFEIGGWIVRSKTDSESSCAKWCWGLVVTHNRLKEIISNYV